MELLKGLRDLQGLGDDDIISDSRDQLDRNAEGLPKGLPPGEATALANLPDEPEFEHGGMVEYKTPTEAKPRGIHASLTHERDSEEKSNTASKERKARIKAYETLINGGK